MNCKETQRCVNLFLKDKLDENAAEEFMLHVHSCRECMEELTIQYLVTEGMQRLESASAFDAQRELEEKLEKALYKKHVHKRLKAGLFMFGAMTACVVFLVGSSVLLF